MGTEKAVQVHVVNLHVDSSKYAVNNVVNSVVCVCVRQTFDLIRKCNMMTNQTSYALGSIFPL